MFTLEWARARAADLQREAAASYRHGRERRTGRLQRLLDRTRDDR